MIDSLIGKLRINLFHATKPPRMNKKHFIRATDLAKNLKIIRNVNMVKYRRYRIKGGVYFFTLALQDRKSDYLTRYINELGAAIRHVKSMHPFKIIAMC